MGDPAVLRDFVAWAIKTYPAKKYALILWDHGDGYRDMKVGPKTGKPDEVAPKDVFRSTTDSPHRAISDDETSNDQLYNREFQEVLEAELVQPLELIGFDACLMAMVETAYAVRKVAGTMVASEELEPGTGWPYDTLLRRLVAKPEMDGAELGRLIVDTYGARYGSASITPRPDTTLSAVDLRLMPGVSTSLSKFSNKLRAALETELPHVIEARDACKEYAPRKGFLHVDLIRFLHEYSSRTEDPALRQSSEALATSIEKSVLSRWAGQNRRGSYGSHGLAIYFPSSGRDYLNDTREKGAYQKDNRFQPVEFVALETWADFLHAFFKLRVRR